MHLLNRILVVVFAALMAVALLALLIIVWADPQAGADRLGDLTSYLDERTGDTLPRALISLAAAAAALLALMLIILEVAPEGRDRIRLPNAKDGTTELSAASVNRRIESDLRRVPAVREARAQVRAHASGVAVHLELWIDQDANLAEKSDEACRLVKQTMEERIGVPLSRQPRVYIRYAEPAPAGGAVAGEAAPAPAGPAAPPAAPTDGQETAD